MGIGNLFEICNLEFKFFMVNLELIETNIKEALKAKDPLTANTLRGLKVRIQNEKIAKMSRGAGSTSGGRELEESEIVALIRSEVKRRKESAAAFTTGGRAEMAEKELQEAGILEKYLPAQMPEGDLVVLIEKTISENGFIAKDFGVAMGKIKAAVGDKADGATLAKILKEKLK